MFWTKHRAVKNRKPFSGKCTKRDIRKLAFENAQNDSKNDRNLKMSRKRIGTMYGGGIKGQEPANMRNRSRMLTGIIK